jgi:hypothetical protein
MMLSTIQGIEELSTVFLRLGSGDVDLDCPPLAMEPEGSLISGGVSWGGAALPAPALRLACSLDLVISVVPAWLWPEDPALAWPEVAPAS